MLKTTERCHVTHDSRDKNTKDNTFTGVVSVFRCVSSDSRLSRTNAGFRPGWTTHGRERNVYFLFMDL